MTILVIYHASCADGHCAAWLLHKVYPDAEYHPAHYGSAPPDCAGRDVWIVDFSYPRAVLWDVAGVAASLRIFDHHATAQADLAGFADECPQYNIGRPTIVFDMNKSGGMLTWEYLVEHGLLIDRRPWLVDYSQDRDLWRWGLGFTRQVNANLHSYPLDFAVWDTIMTMMPDAPDTQFISEGEAIMRREAQIVATHVAAAYEVTIAGHVVRCVNATTLISEIAGELAIGRPFGVCFFQKRDRRFVYSLRSAPDGIDVSEVAKSFGGGGHKHAAGFTTDNVIGG